MAAAAPDRNPPTPVSTLSEHISDAWHFDVLGISYVARLPLLVKPWCEVEGSMGRGDFHLLLHDMADAVSSMDQVRYRCPPSYEDNGRCPERIRGGSLVVTSRRV